MPVSTRNQIKNDATTRIPVATRIPVEPEENIVEEEKIFVNKIKHNLNLLNGKTTSEIRMRLALRIFDIVNTKLLKMLKYNTPKWIKFAVVVYNKILEFENDIYETIEPQLVNKFTETYSNVKKTLTDFFKNIRYAQLSDINLNEKKYVDIYKNIDLESRPKPKPKLKPKQSATRPKRNIKIVDYTGMDTIEPHDEYDRITDIWYDLSKDSNSIFYDSDYNPEDDN